MRTKIFPGGNLDTYVEGPKDHRGEDREQQPIHLSGHLKLRSDSLRNQAPAFVNETDQKRRMVRYLQRYLIHIIFCFSEAQAIVERLLPVVIKAQVDFMLAGMFRESVAFSWDLHPQNIATHAHGTSDCRLLPRGGPYHLNLSAKDRLLFDRVLSHKLGLSDPLSRFPLLLACDPSCGKANIKQIRLLIDEVHALDAEKKAAKMGITRQELFGLLEKYDFELLAAPDTDGRTKLLVPRAEHIRLLNGVLVTRTNDSLVYFKGPLTRLDYDLDRRRRLERKRQEAIDYLNNYRHKVVQGLFRRISGRIELQMQYRLTAPAGSKRVLLDEFIWLDGAPEPRRDSPEDQAPVCPSTFELDAEYGSENPTLYGPELLFPYETGWGEPMELELLGGAFPVMAGKWISRNISQEPGPGQQLTVPPPSQTPPTQMPADQLRTPASQELDCHQERLRRKRREIMLQLAAVEAERFREPAPAQALARPVVDGRKSPSASAPSKATQASPHATQVPAEKIREVTVRCVPAASPRPPTIFTQCLQILARFQPANVATKFFKRAPAAMPDKTFTPATPSRMVPVPDAKTVPAQTIEPPTTNPARPARVEAPVQPPRVVQQTIRPKPANPQPPPAPDPQPPEKQEPPIESSDNGIGF